MDDDDDDMLQMFLQESDECLEEMETQLLALEHAPQDEECLGALFRAAHTIKGSSGMFGFEPVVNFTHEIEHLLVRMRNGELDVTPQHITALLPCVDHIKALVNAEMDSAPPEQMQNLQAQSAQLLEQLGLSCPALEQAVKESEEQTPESPVEQATRFNVSAKFHSDALREGMDPASFLRYLANNGEISHLVTRFDDLPPIDELDAESCYTAYQFIYTTDLDEQQVKEAFEFVEQDSEININPIQTQTASIEQPEPKVGELLMEQGLISGTELNNALAQQDADQQLGKNARVIGGILVEQGKVSEGDVEATIAQQKSKRCGGGPATLRIDAKRLDHLIDLVGELVIAGASNALLAKQVGIRTLLDSTQTVSRLIEEIRDSSLHLRMVPIGQTFSRFRRTVRDISQQVGKEINLTLNGEETELDRSVVEKLSDPLMHMLRNAIDHGIEPADVRQQKGKPVSGQIAINARHESGSIVIEVVDDGGGLNKNKILNKAIERGLTTPDAELDDSAIFQFVFEPAFSTADAVSNLSGRGVGMDVVRKNIEALRGNIEVDSTPDIGTTMRIRLPLTLAIIDGFLVKVGNNAYVIPLENIIECIEISNQETAVSGYINLRDELLPYLRLRGLFNEKNAELVHQDMVVVSYGKERAGIIVDELLGEFQTVIKPLGQIFKKVSWITGSTILGTGEVAVILDVAGLIKLSKKHHSEVRV